MGREDPDMRASGGRRAGFTLVEIMVVLGIIFLIMASIEMVFAAMAQGTAFAAVQLTAQARNQQALLAIANDLQTSDSIGEDGVGKKYLDVKDNGAKKNAGISFRKMKGFQADVAHDQVTHVTTNPIDFYVDEKENLVRVEDGVKRVIADHIKDIAFSVDHTGCITIAITSHAGSGSKEVQSTNSVQVTPRNTLKL
jgi:hypothetical protein